MALLGPGDGVTEWGAGRLPVWAEQEPREMADRESGPRPQITKITIVIRLAIIYKVLTLCLMLG